MNQPNDSEKDLFILMNEFEQESHGFSTLRLCLEMGSGLVLSYYPVIVITIIQ